MSSKQFWVSIPAENPELAAIAIEAGATALVVPPELATSLQQQARTILIADRDADGVDRVIGRDIDRLRIDTEADEEQVAPDRLTIIEPAQWTIIPLENLLSRGAKVIQTVHTPQEAQIALTTMEHGAAGILLVDADATTTRATGKAVTALSSPGVSLQPARIVTIEPAGIGDRSCIDTVGLFTPGEGLLIGDYAHAQFLVHSENITTEHCAARPFRVNAGAVHGYVRQPGDRTRYLGEVRSGDEVLVTSATGETRKVSVGRNKIERRPLLHVVAESGDGTQVSAMLQNAETIHLVEADGTAKSITALQPGDNVLVATTAIVGRHFGRAIEESIREQ